MGVKRYRKKPVEIDALRYDSENAQEALDFAAAAKHAFVDPSGQMVIVTLEGNMVASHGDWIVKGVAGEFYPVKPEIFEATYEAVS